MHTIKNEFNQKLFLPAYCKWIGFAILPFWVVVVFFVGWITSGIGAEIALTWLSNGFILSLVVVAISREKEEGTEIFFLRMQSFLFAFLATAFLPLFTSLTQTFSSFFGLPVAFELSMSNTGLVIWMLLVFHIYFRIMWLITLNKHRRNLSKGL